MLRYLAFVWNPLDIQQRETVGSFARVLREDSPEWKPTVTVEGLHVYCIGARPNVEHPYVFSNQQGVILGRLFSRARLGTGNDAIDELTERDSTHIQDTAGRCLTSEYWGRYVLIAKHPKTGSVVVLRDPMGIVRCFETMIKGVRTFFSHVGDCIQLGFVSNVNFDYIAAFLQTKYAPECGETALSKVSPVLGGEAVLVDRERSSRLFYWDPRSIAETARLDDIPTAVRLLRHAVRSSVHAWALSHSSILLQLSGGLDSSILATCLKDAPNGPDVHCLNLHSAGSDGDERNYARLVAAKTGFPLIERARDPAANLAGLLTMPLSVNPRPSSWMFYILFGKTVIAVARDCGATGIYTGEYGDQIFYQGPAMLASMDYACTRGIGSGFFGTCLDVARLAGPSIWRVIAQGIWHGPITRHNGMQWAKTLSEYKALPFELSQSRQPSDALRFVHPWLKSPGRLPIGKFEHLSQVSFSTFTIENTVQELSGMDQVSPLYSQPLIETSLRIPTYLHLKGGWDRAIARRAFACDLPREITTRRIKGGREEHAKATLYRNIKLVREMLLDGLLVREGILDRNALERTLSGESTGPRSTMSDLYFSLGTEAWIRGWHAARQRRAA